jgi:D-glucosaminate-6-phosphate ammonia-lyase
MNSNSDFFERYALTRVINVSGTMTYLGSSIAVPPAVAAGAGISNEFVKIDQLQAAASRVISRLTGSEAGFVTACSAAGIVLGIAGCMTGPNLARIEGLPDVSGLNNQVVVQAGHLINYGAPIEQAIRLSGAQPVPVGTASLAHAHHLENAITENTAAALYVVSHHVVQEGQIPLTEFAAICRSRSIPLIVDMASEYDLRSPLELGAALAIYSSHKFLGGPTAGIVAGNTDAVRNAYLQNRGIGRPMKVGKEGIAGTMAALEAWQKRDHQAVKNRESACLHHWREALPEVPGLKLALHKDWTGNPIERLKVTVDPQQAGLYAWELADRLAAGDPVIQVRDDLIDGGYFFLDPCNLKAGQDIVVSSRIREEVEKALSNKDGLAYSVSDRKNRTIQAVLSWPRDESVSEKPVV